MAGRFGIIGRLVHLFGVANAFYYLLHVLNADGLHSLVFKFAQQFGHTVLYVVGYLCPTLAFVEVAVHVVNVLFEQLAGIVVDGIQHAKHVDGNILFHNAGF